MVLGYDRLAFLNTLHWIIPHRYVVTSSNAGGTATLTDNLYGIWIRNVQDSELDEEKRSWVFGVSGSHAMFCGLHNLAIPRL